MQWYDVVVCICYFSFFFLPYVTAGVMWLRSRTDFYRWSLRFVGLSFFSFALFLLIPAAPPWAAARCTPAEVAGHPNNPACMYSGDPVPRRPARRVHHPPTRRESRGSSGSPTRELLRAAPGRRPTA